MARLDPSLVFLAAVTLIAAPALFTFWAGDEIYSLGFLVLPWALWYVASRPRTDAAPESWRVAAFATSAALGLLAWSFRSVTLALWAVVAAAAVVALERGTQKQALVPLGLLAITVPPPGFDGILLKSQLAVAASSEWMLGILGTPVHRNTGGFLLQAPVYNYSVEPLCTGLSGILATVALVGIAALHLGSPRRMALYALGAGVAATVILNIVRIVALVLVTESQGPKYIEGAFHETSSLVLSLLAFAVTIPFLLRKAHTMEAP